MKEAPASPAYLLWSALTKTMSDFQSLWVNVWSVRDQFKALDETGVGPDLEIDANVSTWIHNRRRPCYLVCLMRAKRELNRALDGARLASQSINDVHAAALPFGTRGRVERHVRETEQLISLFDGFERQYAIPTLPRNIREQALSELCLDFDNVLEQLTGLVGDFEGQDLPQSLRSVLVEQKTETASVAREISALREQSDRELSVPFNEQMARVESIKNALSELKTSARIECQKLGMKFYNRAGEIK